MSEESERPVPPRPRSTSSSDPKDPLWKTVGDLSANVAQLFIRVDAVEVIASGAHRMATEARTKIDALAVSQVQAQNDFTAAVKAQTDALKSFGTSIDDVRKTGRWLVILIVVMSIATVASIFMR